MKRMPSGSRKGVYPNSLLDNLLTLDKRLVELSMNLYNVPVPERSKMRAQNRRLHKAVRAHMRVLGHRQTQISN